MEYCGFRMGKGETRESSIWLGMGLCVCLPSSSPTLLVSLSKSTLEMGDEPGDLANTSEDTLSSHA